MKVKILRSILALSLVLGLLSGMLIAAPVAAAAATTWYVDDSGGADFTTIQAAVDAASTGDTIIVRDGTYVENVVVTKSLVIQSQNGRATTIVQAADPAVEVFYILASNVVIDGFTAQGVTAPYRGGISIFGWDAEGNPFPTTGCVIRNNDCSNNEVGFYMCNAYDTTTLENNVASNCTFGVFIDCCSGILVTRNTFSANDYGVGLNYALSNILYLNNIIDSAISNVEDDTPGSSSGGIWNSQAPVDYSYSGSQYTGYVGNYWGGYSGVDVDGNGIGDTPYQTFTSPDEFDNYPLMGQYGVAITEPAPALEPVAAFTSDVQSGTAPLTVQFTDESTNTPTSWAWDFDNDGTVDSTVQNPTYIYAAGTYTVKLTATNGFGSDDEVKTSYITATVAGSSSSLTLNANVVRPVVGIQLDKSSVNYGDIKPGHDSAVETVRVTNTGNVAADVTLEVQGNGTDAQSFYEQSLWVNSALYNSSTVLATIAETLYSDVATQLKVPLAWDKTGAQQAVFIFWAEESG
jgi:parallel beta-helix repeat protein